MTREKAGAAPSPELDLFERWAAVHRFVPAAQRRRRTAGCRSSFAHAVDHEDLVPLRRPDTKLPMITEGPLSTGGGATASG